MSTFEIFLTAIGIVLVVEGVPYAFFPGGMKKILQALPSISNIGLRLMGFGIAALGFALVWLAQQ